MLPEELSSNSPPPSSSDRQPLTRADVAIGSLSQQLVNRSDVRQPQTATPQPAVRTMPPVMDNNPFVASPQPDTQQAPQNQPGTFAASPSPQQPQPNTQQAQSFSPQDPIQQKTTPAANGKLKRMIVPALVVLAVVFVGGGIFGWLHWQSVQNNPTTIFSDALQASLTTTQLQAQTVTNSADDTVDYDFTSATNPLVSSQETVSMFGSSFRLAGYGSAANTYVSYTKFPADISPTITSLATNGWVQLRSQGALPSGINSTLTDAADPRYQAIGLLTFGNFSTTTRTQLVNYLLNEHIYAYQLGQVSHTTLNGAKVLAYPVTLNINYLKIYDESIAADEGFSPNGVQDAVNALSNWQGAHATFYVSADSHRFVQVSLKQANQATTISYSNYNKDTLPGEPETKLTWQSFAPIQQMIDQQAASHKTIAAFNSQPTKVVAAAIHN